MQPVGKGAAMLKVIGICCILCGVFAGIMTWDAGRKEKIRLLEEITDFLRRAESAVEHQTPVIDFLQSYTGMGQVEEVRGKKDNPLENALRELACELEKNQWSSGEEAWKYVLNRNREKWNFTEEQWELLCQIGQIADGRSRKALMEILALLKTGFLEMQRAEQSRRIEQRRVVLPVGMLAGVMLVLLFL